MSKTKEELEMRKKEILLFLSKHFKNDPDRIGNFITKFPNYSETDLNMDESSEANEVADYQVDLAIEQTLENELLDIEDKLENL